MQFSHPDLADVNEPKDDRPSLVAPEIIMADLVLPNQTNYYRTLFGGVAMAMMDKAAAIAALRFCRLPIVTASTEHIDFREPIHESEIIEAMARVIYTGNSSLVARVHVYGEEPLKAHRRLCTTGYFNMVAVGPDGTKLRMPRLVIGDEEAEEEWIIGERIHKAIVNRRRRK
jgi:acyl-CoA hydrolase